jgi:oxalate decarboxylase/phosphoglucose isomerase-like protein (cupin superfamily)
MYKFFGDEANPYAIVIFKNILPIENSSQFLTNTNSAQQIGIMRRKSGHIVRAHKHNPIIRTIKSTQEVLFIIKGRCKVKIFDIEGKFFAECIISSGDVIFLARGGHSIEFIEDSTFIEVKQGPYVGAEDKEFI